jgi:hypothetical protein
MKIIATQEFLDGRMRFKKDSAYDVPDAASAFFVRMGWAVPIPPDDLQAVEVVAADQLHTDAPLPPQGADTALDVQNIASSQSATTVKVN